MIDFYRFNVTEKEEERVVVEVVFNEKHPIFKGHFPSKPIVPGVMLMQTVKELFEDMSGISSTIESADLKFMNPVIPGKENQINIEIKHEKNGDDRYKVKSSGYLGEIKYFKINVVLRGTKK